MFAVTKAGRVSEHITRCEAALPMCVSSPTLTPFGGLNFSDRANDYTRIASMSKNAEAGGGRFG